MIIHSKFNDYYDCIQKYGQDSTQHWVRNTSEVKLAYTEPAVAHIKDQRYPIEYLDNSSPYSSRWTWYWLGIAGKVYPIYTNTEQFMYSTDAIIDNIKASDKKGDKLRSFLARAKYSRKSQKIYFDNVFEDTKAFEYLFSKYNAALWLLNRLDYAKGYVLTINPILKQFDFQTVLDPMTCYQEITMYLSGVLGCSCPTTVEVADKYRIDGHGFDKWSFRKLPTKHKGKN